jgi:ubiquinone biosynthesis protein UbiJ
MEAAVPIAMIALIAFVAGVVALAAVIGSKLYRRPYEAIDAMRDEVAALSTQVDRLRGQVERMEQRNGPPSDAIKAGN